MIKICFICTGNTCRSIIAERIAKKKVKQIKNIEFKFTSKGINANGENITDNAKIVLKGLGALATNRKSVKLKKNESDILYVTMTEQQKDFVKSKFNTEKIISFSSLLGYDISDPYGKDLDAYKKTANDIEKGIDILLNKLINWR